MYDLLSGRFASLGPPNLVQRSKTTFKDPLHWHTPQGIFTCSLSDFFIAQADDWRDEAWEIIRHTPQHAYLVLTKRPERIADYLPEGWPWPHVWLGVSVETPEYWWRADVLQAIPAAHRFLSCEPLLADLGTMHLDGVDWVIVGGESTAAHRPMPVAWVESIAVQCHAAGVPLFVKQASAVKPGQQGDLPDALWAQKARPWETWTSR